MLACWWRERATNETAPGSSDRGRSGNGVEGGGVVGLTLGVSVVWGDGWVGGASSVRGPGKLTLQVE